MKKLFLYLIMFISGMPTMAQTARSFVLKNSADGESELTVYLPQAPSGRAIIDCPGGGYSHLAMNHEGHDWAEYFNAQGITYCVLKYRMPKGDRNIPLGDAYRAIKTVRDSAQAWHVNPYDVGIMGFSAGGHLASSVSTHADWTVRPNFTILFYPVVTLGTGTHKGSCDNFLGEERDDKQMVRMWSNEAQVRPHLTPPAVVFLANDDQVVPPLPNGVAYYSAMRNQGINCSLYVYPSGGHGFGFRPEYIFHQQMLDELTMWLKTLPSPRIDAIRVACIGNSITDGSGIDLRDVNSYPAQMQRLLGGDYHVRNFGISARTLLNKGDHPYMKETYWHDVLAFNPQIVVVKLGTNDSKTANWVNGSEFGADLQQMIDTLKSLSAKPTILLCTPIPALTDAWTINDSIIVNGIIPIQKKLARKNKLVLVDLHSAFQNQDGKQLQHDGIHPTQSGAEQLSEIIADYIKNQRDYLGNDKIFHK